VPKPLVLLISTTALPEKIPEVGVQAIATGSSCQL